MVSESNQAIFKFFAVFEILNNVASMVANMLLVALILFRSSREIGAYRYLLLAFALNDVFYPIMHLLTLPVICAYKDSFIMFANGILTSKLSICIFAAFFSETMPLLAHLFVYRLIATKWPRHLPFYTGTSCSILLLITWMLAFSSWFLNCYFGYAADQEIMEYIKPFLDQDFEGEEHEVIGVLYYSTEGAFRVADFMATMRFNGIMANSSSVIIFCSSSIVHHFRSAQVQWSEATKKLQKQLFLTLLIQMLIPMLFVYLPCAAVINLPMLGFRLNSFPNLVSAVCTIFPLIDAFIVIFGVASYRNAFFAFLLCKSKNVNGATVSTTKVTAVTSKVHNSVTETMKK